MVTLNMPITYLELFMSLVALAFVLHSSSVVADLAVRAQIISNGVWSDNFQRNVKFDRRLITFALIMEIACLVAIGHQYLSTRPGQFEQTYVPTANCQLSTANCQLSRANELKFVRQG